MAYSVYVNQTWVDGSSSTPLSAARMGVIETGNLNSFYAPAVRAKRTSTLALTTATWTLLTLNGEDFDTAGNAADTQHDNVTNSNRLTAKYAGKYAYAGTIVFASNATGLRAVEVQKNSEALPATDDTGVVIGGGSTNAVNGTLTRITVAGIVDMAVNDYITCIAFQNSGGNLNIQTDTNFEMVRVG